MTLTIKQVAAECQVHPWTVYAWIRSGRLDCAKLGAGKRSPVRITREQLDQFLSESSGRYRGDE